MYAAGQKKKKHHILHSRKIHYTLFPIVTQADTQGSDQAAYQARIEHIPAHDSRVKETCDPHRKRNRQQHARLLHAVKFALLSRLRQFLVIAVTMFALNNLGVSL